LKPVPVFRPSSVNTEKSRLKSVPAAEIHGKLQPIRRLYACRFSSRARETATKVTPRGGRWTAAPSTLSAVYEQPGQPASGQPSPVTPLSSVLLTSFPAYYL